MTQYTSIYKYLLFVLAVFISLRVLGQAQISIQQLDLNKLPKGVECEGKIKMAVRWVDKLGDNIVLLTETGIYQSAKFKHENEGGDAELFAYHFIVNNKAVQTWSVYDFIADCPVDIEAQFVKNAFQVTDLNDDGVGEVWIMYKTSCRGDVSPSDMKIIMYQGQQKFAMRGQDKVFAGTDERGKREYIGGDYKYDKAFADGPQSFLDFAKKMWIQNRMLK